MLLEILGNQLTSEKFEELLFEDDIDDVPSTGIKWKYQQSNHCSNLQQTRHERLFSILQPFRYQKNKLNWQQIH